MFRGDVMAFNKKIIIQKKTPAKDNDGYDIETWIDFKTLWAYANGISNKEFYKNLSEMSENIINFTVRYSTSLSAVDMHNYRIIFEDRVFDIIGIDDFELRHLTIVFRTKEAANGKA